MLDARSNQATVAEAHEGQHENSEMLVEEVESQKSLLDENSSGHPPVLGKKAKLEAGVHENWPTNSLSVVFSLQKEEKPDL
jgi:hypothetical protein